MLLSWFVADWMAGVLQQQARIWLADDCWRVEVNLLKGWSQFLKSTWSSTEEADWPSESSHAWIEYVRLCIILAGSIMTPNVYWTQLKKPGQGLAHSRGAVHVLCHRNPPQRRQYQRHSLILHINLLNNIDKGSSTWWNFPYRSASENCRIIATIVVPL